MTRWDALKHAFAVDPKGPCEPTPEQQPAVDWVCHQVVKRDLATPALMALELFRPLNYVSAQAMHFFKPLFGTLSRTVTINHYKHFAAFLEHRGSFPYLVQRIEAMAAGEVDESDASAKTETQDAETQPESN